MRKVKYKEGDIFAVSLAKSEENIIKFLPPYAFGRIIAIFPSKDQIVEYYNRPIQPVY